MPIAILRALLAAALCLSALPAQADVVDDWNAIFERAIPAGDNYVAAAAMNLAMFEALNAIEDRYEPFGQSLDGYRAALPDIAASVAAHDVLAAQASVNRGLIDAELERRTQAASSSPSLDKSLQLGRLAAARMLALPVAKPLAYRAYPMPEPAAGAWALTPGHRTTSSAARQDAPGLGLDPRDPRFDPGAPPPPESEKAKADRSLSKRVGGRQSAERTADQTAAAIFWNTHFTERVLIRNLMSNLPFTPLERARAYALLRMAYQDLETITTIYKVKYAHWRPYNAIRGPNADPALRDATWEPLLRTPANPEWPSSSAIVAGMYDALLAHLDPKAGIAWRLYVPEIGLERSWASARAMDDEYASSRLWSGLHFSSSLEASRRIGRLATQHLIDTRLAPRKPGPARP